MPADGHDVNALTVLNSQYCDITHVHQLRENTLGFKRIFETFDFFNDLLELKHNFNRFGFIKKKRKYILNNYNKIIQKSKIFKANNGNIRNVVERSLRIPLVTAHFILIPKKI